MKLELQATPRDVMRSVEALQQLGREQQVPEKVLFGLALALEECASNIVKYALQYDASRKFVAAFEYSGSTIVIELRDQGPEFDPTKVPLSEKEEAGDDRPPGGWGIRLARSHTDEMHYAREGRENVLRLVSRFGLMKQSVLSNYTLQGGNSTMKLDIQIQENTSSKLPGTITVRLAGSLDTATSPELERKLTPVLAGPVKGLVFDLAQLRFISSAGLRVISIARKKLWEKGGTTVVVNMQPQIKEVFDIVRSLPGMNIFENVAEFDEYITARQRMHEEEGR